jgi:hypothetical protein
MQNSEGRGQDEAVKAELVIAGAYMLAVSNQQV